MELDNSMNKNEMTLPGKIAVVNIQADSCTIYDNSNIGKIKFKIGRFNDTSLGGYCWMNTSDHFVASEYIRTKNGPTDKGNLVETDIEGKFIDYIYKVNTGEFADGAYLTKNDSLLLFTINKKGDKKINPFEGLMRMNSIVIMDFKSRKIIKTIDSVGYSPIFSMEESPWFYNGNSFIYSINYQNGIGGADELIEKGKVAGVYIYNLAEDKIKLLIPDASFGICSPTDSIIAYKMGQSVYCFNLKNNTSHLIFKANKNQKVQNIHWTPDGKYVYLVYFTFYLSDIDFDTDEKLIEVATGKEMPFKKIHHGYMSYSWE